MRKIYFNDKRLLIVEDKTKQNPSTAELKTLIDKIISVDSPDEIVIKCGSEAETLIVLLAYFNEVPAAGGIVLNQNDEILFIFRKDKWDLPKGKIDEGETAEKAAIREVQEECGLKNLKIVKQLPSTYHYYTEDDQAILKKTNWYLMQTTDSVLKPQQEEGIAKAEWKKPPIGKDVLENTYGSIRDVLESVN
ncbi:MAG: NUDIX hydrolase [Bacteroidia bacterium]